MGSGPAVAEIRDVLSPEQYAEFVGFDSERERNVLQLLADAEFDAWRQVVDIGPGEGEQALYRALHHLWESRLSPPPAEGMGGGDLAEWGMQGNRAFLEEVAGIVSDEDFELMRSTQEIVHRLKFNRGRR